MRNLLTCCLWATYLLVPTYANPTDTDAEVDADGEFVSLFDGKTLDGWWKHTGVPEFHVGGKWEVVDGVLIGEQDPPGRGGFLCTKQKYSDYVIHMEVHLDYPSDSGVFLRMGDDGKSHQVTLDNRPGGDFGAIYLPWTQAMVHENPEGINAFRQNEWNEVEVRIEGEPSRIQCRINGELVTDFQHTEETTRDVPSEGYIGLQVHPTVSTHVNWKEGNKVRFRNIRIRDLTTDRKSE